VYKELGLRYCSPTIWCWFYTDDFLLFANNLKDFIKNGKFSENKKLSKENGYPVANLQCKAGEIVVYFNHYPTCAEAIKKWQERSKRVNWDNIYIILCNSAKKEEVTSKTLKMWQQVEYPKIWITNDKTIPNSIFLRDAFEDNENDIWNNGQFIRSGGNKYAYFEFDFVKFLNQKRRR
jgi:uncharacterized protein (DUF1919 family)